jgi:transcriptional regulator with XRE-family HTH domain
MTRHDLYAWCATQGMTQADTARHVGVTEAAVSRWRRRHGASFSTVPVRDQMLGRKLEMRFYLYPWEEMQVGDYFEADGHALQVAHRGNVMHFPKRFRSVTRQGFNLVVRAA